MNDDLLDVLADTGRDSILAPEPFPGCAEPVLLRYILNGGDPDA